MLHFTGLRIAVLNNWSDEYLSCLNNSPTSYFHRQQKTMTQQHQALLAQAEQYDQTDTLAHYQEQFHFPLHNNGEPLRYFCGHSLGLQPKQAMQHVHLAMDIWRFQGIDHQFEGGKPWLKYMQDLNAGMATLVGADTAEVTVMNALTVNLHLLLASFFQPQGQRCKIVIEQGAFPSDRYAVISQLRWHGLDPERDLIEIAPAAGQRHVDEAQVEALLQAQGEQIALVMFPGVQFLTGQFFDLQRITRAAHQAGAMAGFDLAHAAGNLPLQLHDSGADFAAWCSYKYMNGSPGTLGGCFIHARHHGNPELVKLAGWWANAPETRFDMPVDIDWASGADAWQISNPPLLTAAPLIAALAIHNAAGMAALRSKSIALTGYLEQLLNTLLSDHCEIITPADPARRGCQLSMRVKAGTEQGEQLFQQLRNQGFICDWRRPDIMRIAPVPLYNSFADVRDLAVAMRNILVTL